jgi:hypothetical protein
LGQLPVTTFESEERFTTLLARFENLTRKSDIVKQIPRVSAHAVRLQTAVKSKERKIFQFCDRGQEAAMQ